MKKVFTIVAVLVFVLAVGSVFANDLMVIADETETAPVRIAAAPSKDFGHVPGVDVIYDVGTMLYISAFETKSAGEVVGAAAGGVAKEDENTKIWDNLMPSGATLE
jgi:hypothetical protein